jgi:endonuclease/exonuclease/phosphatase (EEP) superfamily protein YafD
VRGIGPRSLLRIPVFAAAVLVLVLSLAARVAWTAWPVELLSNFPVQLTVVGILVVLGTLLVRAPISAILAAAAVVISGTSVLGTLLTDVPPARPNGERITVGHLNAQTRRVDTAALGSYLERTRPDVFVVLEPYQSDIPALRRSAPSFETRLTSVGDESPAGYARTVVFSRRPLRGVVHPGDRRFDPAAVQMAIDTGDGPIALLVFGTDSPTSPGRAHSRDRALNAAAQWSRARGPRRIVMGDLNVTPWSPSFGRIIRDGDLANSLDGFGIQPSWPESNALIRIPIDHALIGPGLATTDRGTGPAFGSQHRSLHVTVAPAP